MYYENTLDKKKVGEFLRDSINNKYGTIAEYARETGQVYQTVHSWTSGSRLPELEDMVANCNILDMPLEYTLVGTNLKMECDDSDVETEENERRLRARRKYPNLLFGDIAIIIPLIDTSIFLDILNRVIDCNDSFYVYNLFSKYVRTDSDAWKYCVYTLQERNSPLVMKIEKIKAEQKELSKWYRAYYKKKNEYLEGMRKVIDSFEKSELV